MMLQCPFVSEGTLHDGVDELVPFTMRTLCSLVASDLFAAFPLPTHPLPKHISFYIDQHTMKHFLSLSMETIQRAKTNEETLQHENKANQQTQLNGNTGDE